MCIRCNLDGDPAVDDLHLCSYCATLTRIEVERGLVLIQAYLGKWARFERWLDSHGHAVA
jgi:hypothetical protein